MHNKGSSGREKTAPQSLDVMQATAGLLVTGDARGKAMKKKKEDSSLFVFLGVAAIVSGILVFLFVYIHALGTIGDPIRSPDPWWAPYCILGGPILFILGVLTIIWGFTKIAYKAYRNSNDKESDA